MIDHISNNIVCLNMSELKIITNMLNIDIYYYVEYKIGELTKGAMEKKAVIIKKILRNLENKKIKNTVIPSICVYKNLNKNDKLTAHSKVYFGQYVNGNKEIFDLMKNLTEGKFTFGVIAQNILFNEWKKGKLISYKQLAKKWMTTKIGDHPEWQYIEYVRKNGTHVGWSKYRSKIARHVIKAIRHLKNI